MKAYTVYRVDYIRQVREPVGVVLERRRSDRGNNYESLLDLARKIYLKSSLDSHISIVPELKWD